MYGWMAWECPGYREARWVYSDLLFDITTYNDWLYLNPKDNGEYLKATEYLDQRIAEDGDWGLF